MDAKARSFLGEYKNPLQVGKESPYIDRRPVNLAEKEKYQNQDW